MRTWLLLSVAGDTNVHRYCPRFQRQIGVLFSLTLAVGRLFGDRLVVRFGRIRVVHGCGAVAAAGSLLVIAAPTAPLSLAGWALFGLGLAALAPTVLGAATSACGASPAVAIAAVSTLGYLGSFPGAPAIGALAEISSLSTALGLLVAVSALMLVLARPGLRERTSNSAPRPRVDVRLARSTQM